MPCYHPLEGWRSRVRTSTGKLGITFSVKDAYLDLPVTVPCGQCIGCRLERSRQWAIRCVYEASLHEENCFITLTYDDEHLPADCGLCKRDFQLFMKRLRKRFSDRKISFFHCGEYGEQFGRPHYHAIIFGLDFKDRELFSSRGGVDVFTSACLMALWPFGNSTVGNVTFESSAYVARYVMKKVTGEAAERHYQRVVAETGEIVQVQPEYITMSLKPAIGKCWFEQYSADVFPSDFVVFRGKEMKPPKYFERLFAVKNLPLLEQLKLRRIKKAVKFKGEQSPDRLRVREVCKLAQISNLKRSVE